VSAAQELESARAALDGAQSTHAGLQARIAGGDVTITGSQLVSAEADVRVATGIVAGAELRAEQEQLAQDEAARQAAIDLAAEQYKVTAADLTTAVDGALTALARLVAVAANHQDTTRSNLSAVGLSSAAALPGHGRLVAPEPVELIEGVAMAASLRAGIRSAVPHPHLALEPIASFLGNA